MFLTVQSAAKYKDRDVVFTNAGRGSRHSRTEIQG